MKKFICICLLLGIVTGCAERSQKTEPALTHPKDKEVHKLPPVKPDTEKTDPAPDLSFVDAIDFYFSLHDDNSIIMEIAYRPLHDEGIYEVKAAVEDNEVEIMFDANHAIISETNEYLDRGDIIEVERDGFTRDDVLELIPVQDAISKALETKPGQFVEVELQKKHNVFVYEIEINGEGHKSFDVKIDAKTAKVLKVD